MPIFTEHSNTHFFQIEKFNHVTQKSEGRKSFKTKKEANEWLKQNTEKRGYDYFSLTDRSIEFIPCY